MAKRVESPSSINTFKQCPRKYYYHYIAKFPTLPNIHQVRGNIAHSVLENFYDTDLTSFTTENYPLKLKEVIQNLFIQSWKKYSQQLELLQLSKDQQIFYFEETMFMLMNWTNQFIEKITILIKEKNIGVQDAFLKLTPRREEHYKSDHYSVRGYIDAIHEIEDEVQIIDYKTNANFEMKDELRLQLAIYSLLYFEKHGKMPSKVGVFFLRHKLKLMPVDQSLLDFAKKEIMLVHEHTSRTEEINDYPKCVSNLCKWSTGQCDFYEVCKPHESPN